MRNAFIDIEIHVNYGLARQYLLGRDGLLRDVLRLVGGAFLLLLAVSLQVGLPCGFPEFPLYPAVWLCGYMFSTGGRFRFLWPVLGGLFLDGAAFGRCGESSLLLMASSAMFGWVLGALRSRDVPYVLAVGICSGASTWVWCLLRLLFCLDSSLVGRMKMLVMELPLAVFMGMLGGGFMLCCLHCLTGVRRLGGQDLRGRGERDAV